jgi:uncharacterized membrane protein
MNDPCGEGATRDDRLVPYRRLAPSAPLRWLRRGFDDLCAAPALSLALGAVAVAISAALAGVFFFLGGGVALLAGLSAFVFGGPLLAVACYEVPRARLAGRRPSLGAAIGLARRTLGEAMVLAIVLLVVGLLWIRAASLVHVFFPVSAEEGFGELVPFLAVGTMVGAVFAAAVFAASAFSLPLVADRRVEMMIAVLSSVRAVLANPGASVVWAMSIGLVSAIGIATALLGLALVVPWLGYATFHACREALIAEDWPPREAISPPLADLGRGG